MEHKKITGNDLAKMMPEMVKSMDAILDRSQKYLSNIKESFSPLDVKISPSVNIAEK